MLLHECKCDVLQIGNGLRVADSQLFLPVIADPDVIRLVDESPVQLRNAVQLAVLFA
ncbi:hypothetical protein D3C80_1900500 [compost metagenome]